MLDLTNIISDRSWADVPFVLVVSSRFPWPSVIFHVLLFSAVILELPCAFQCWLRKKQSFWRIFRFVVWLGLLS